MELLMEQPLLLFLTKKLWNLREPIRETWGDCLCFVDSVNAECSIKYQLKRLES